MIDHCLLESASPPPASIAGLVTPFVLVPLDRWIAGQGPADWMQQAIAAKVASAGGKPWDMNCGGWGITRLIDETIPASYHLPSTTSQAIIEGIKRGCFNTSELIPVFQPFFDACDSLSLSRPRILWDDGFERIGSPSPIVRAAFPHLDDKAFHQAFGQAAYNTLAALANNFRIDPSAVVCAGITSEYTPWSYPVACLRDHCWFSEFAPPPNSVVTLSAGEYGPRKGADALPLICSAIRELDFLPHKVTLILYAEPSAATNLASPEMAQALHTYVGGN